MSEKKTVRERLECVLTGEEMVAYSKECAQAFSQKTQAEDTKKSYVDQIKAEVSNHDSVINMLTKKINAGKEYRLVEVDVSYDFAEGIKEYHRSDTGEMIRRMPIHDDEMQTEMSLDTEEEAPPHNDDDMPSVDNTEEEADDAFANVTGDPTTID